MVLLLDAVFVASGAISAALSFSIAYLMLKSFMTVRREYLVGLPIGFSLLAVGYVLTDLSYVDVLVAENVSWIRLFFVSFGFAFILASYFLRRQGQAGEMVSRWGFLGLLGLLCAVVLLISLLPARSLPSHSEADGFFRVGNLIMLSYVIFSLGQALKAEAELSNVVVGFTFLTIDQVNLLIWTFDRVFVWLVVFAQLVRVVGLVILVVFLVRRFEGRS